MDQAFSEDNQVSKPESYERQLAVFLRNQRGEKTFRAFAQKLGISASSLQRLEQADQNVTLRTVRQITRSLRVTLKDIFVD